MNIVVISLETLTAEELRWAPERRCEIPHVDCGTNGPRELASLGGILDCGTSEELLNTMRLVAGESQESPWVISLPEGLITAIAALTAEQMSFFSRQWQRSQQDAPLGSAIRLEEILGELQKLFSGVPGPFALLVFEAT